MKKTKSDIRRKLLARRKQVGDRLKRLRSYRGLSCNDLAAKTSRSRPYISSVENGMNPPTEKLMCLVADVLDVDMDYFIAVSVKEHVRGFVDHLPDVVPGELIKRLRGLRGMSCRVLAKKLSITRSYLSSIENGHHPLTAHLQQDIAGILGVDANCFNKK